MRRGGLRMETVAPIASGVPAVANGRRTLFQRGLGGDHHEQRTQSPIGGSRSEGGPRDLSKARTGGGTDARLGSRPTRSCHGTAPARARSAPQDHRRHGLKLGAPTWPSMTGSVARLIPA